VALDEEERKRRAREKAKERYDADPERWRAYAREQRNKNIEHVRAKDRARQPKRKEAQKIYMAEWRERNRSKMEDYFREYRVSGRAARAELTRRIKSFGITIDEYIEMLREQEEVCAICKQPEEIGVPGQKMRVLSLDHDHDTGKLRGLLCGTCNKALGGFRDDPAILESAMKYLARHGKF
jgi:hypothetical protein